MIELCRIRPSHPLSKSPLQALAPVPAADLVLEAVTVEAVSMREQTSLVVVVTPATTD